MSTTIGGLLPARCVSGFSRFQRDTNVSKSCKGIESASDCDISYDVSIPDEYIKFIPLKGNPEYDIGQVRFLVQCTVLE